MMRTLAALALFSSTALAAPSDDAAMARVPKEWKVRPGIVFKKVGEADLDLMLCGPAEKKFEKSPLVVFIHGGGFAGGDKFHVLRADARDVITALAKEGMTVAAIEYRLAKGGDSAVRESVADCKDAARFLLRHAAEYGLDPDRVATWGESAGGSLTLITALGADADYPCDPAIPGPPVKFRCVVDYYGPVSFVDMALRKGSNFERPERLVSILGGPLELNLALAHLLSPIELLGPESPPLFIAHGDSDPVINVANSRSMRDAAQAKGVPVELVISKGAGHGFSGAPIDPGIPEIGRRTIEFLKKYLTK